MIKVNNEIVEFFKFPDGQCHLDLFRQIPLTMTGMPVAVDVSLTNFEEVIKLLLLCDVLKSVDWQILKLNIAYLTGSRSDRRFNPGQPHTLKVIIDLLNNIDCAQLSVLEPHSDAVEALVYERFSAVGWNDVLHSYAFVDRADKELCRILKNYTIVTPDAGMYKKIGRFCQSFNNFNIVEASKVRDLKSGNIISTHVNGNLGGHNCLVIDDICDGGKTFIELAKAMRSAGAQKLILAVCHGIFSKGFDELLEYYDHIYTTNSFSEINHPNITCIDVI